MELNPLPKTQPELFFQTGIKPDVSGSPLADWENPVWDGPINWKKPPVKPLPNLNTENDGE